jgi:hypothetical protein
MGVSGAPRSVPVTVVEVTLERVVAGAAQDPLVLEWLGPGDIEAIGRLGFPADRDRAATARALVRGELGRRLGVHPRSVPWVGGDGGGIRPEGLGAELMVSWSHSGGWVALAIARGRPVGVDIERVPKRLSITALKRIGVGSLEEFVAREAAGKVSGAGLGGAWAPGTSVRRLRSPDGYLAAVAAPGADWIVRQSLPDALNPPPSSWAVAPGVWALEPIMPARLGKGGRTRS